MAIGLGLLFGFHFPENFNYPYLSRSVSEFWRRWHMTLGGWFRDYVYIPLGGNRVPRLLYIRNIFVVWALTGLWHGAAWNFVVWGLLFGVLLTAEKLFLDKWLQKCGRILPHVYVMAVVVLSFVLFNASSMQGALADIAAVLGLTGAPFAGTLSLYYLKSYAVLLAVSVVGCTPWPKKLALALPEGVRAVLEPVAMAVLLLLVTAYLVDGSFNPFLYFRF